MNYNETAIEKDLYAEWATGFDWSAALADVSERVAVEVRNCGIGTNLDPETGSYDFESGQLLENLPFGADDIDTHEYEAICAIAESYAQYVRSSV